jgi:hypothetical protein
LAQILESRDDTCIRGVTAHLVDAKGKEKKNLDFLYQKTTADCPLEFNVDSGNNSEVLV